MFTERRFSNIQKYHKVFTENIPLHITICVCHRSTVNQFTRVRTISVNHMVILASYGYFTRKLYIVRKVTSAPTFLALSSACPCDVYRTRQVLKYILKPYFMISTVCFSHIVFYTHGFQKYRRNLVAHSFGIILENKFLVILFRVKLWSVVANACLPQRPISQKFRMPNENVPLNVKF